MNFTGEVKRDLLSYFPTDERLRSAELSALFSTSGYLSKSGEVVFVSENEKIAEFFLRLTESLKIGMELVGASRDPKRKRDKLTFSCSGKDAARFLELTLPDTGVYAFAEEDEDALFYLRGAFLGGGSCTLPTGNGKTAFHLEFVFSALETAEGFKELLLGLELIAAVLKRGDSYVVYLKSREAISDFLSLSGADTALRRFEEVSAEREASNHDNRVGNCYASNADRALTASAEQIRRFRKLMEKGELKKLPAPLVKTAQARMDNPTQSLSELAETLGVTKSCINHRIRKLMQYCDFTAKDKS